MRIRSLFVLLFSISLLSAFGCDKSEDKTTEEPAPTEESEEAEAPAETDESATETDEGAEAQSNFKATSSAFDDGEAMPAKFTCDGDGVSPPLSWEGAPEGTKSYVVVVEDPDAPKGTFYHWGIYGLSVDTTSLPAAVTTGGKEGVAAEQAKNSFDKVGYGGPCPPKEDDAHDYRFRVLALDTVGLSFMGTPTIPELLEAAKGNIVEETVLTATYKRK